MKGTHERFMEEARRFGMEQVTEEEKAIFRHAPTRRTARAMAMARQDRGEDVSAAFMWSALTGAPWSRMGQKSGGPSSDSEDEVSERKDLAVRIAGAREAAGITQEELARELGVTVGAVSGWERAIYLPGRKNREKIRGLLGVD